MIRASKLQQNSSKTVVKIGFPVSDRLSNKMPSDARAFPQYLIEGNTSHEA